MLCFFSFCFSSFHCGLESRIHAQFHLSLIPVRIPLRAGPNVPECSASHIFRHCASPREIHFCIYLYPEGKEITANQKATTLV